MKAMNSNAVVAENLRLIRKQLGWSQEFCAEKCGLYRTYIGAVERGERNITIGTLDKIAEAFGTTALHLMTPKGRR